MKVGLYFGTYNPIHIGHLAIANYLVEFSEIDQLWFVVSPQSPFKTKKSLLDNYQRLELVNRAIDRDFRFQASNIEFNLPRPSYTIDTLVYLKDKFPTIKFWFTRVPDMKRKICWLIPTFNMLTHRSWKSHPHLSAKPLPMGKTCVILFPRKPGNTLKK